MRHAQRTLFLCALASTLGFALGRLTHAPLPPEAPLAQDQITRPQSQALHQGLLRRGPSALAEHFWTEDDARQALAKIPFYLLEQAFNERSEGFWNTFIRPLFEQYTSDEAMKRTNREGEAALEDAAAQSEYWTTSIPLSLPSGRLEFNVLMRLKIVRQDKENNLCLETEGWVDEQPDTRFSQTACVEALIRRDGAYYNLLHLNGDTVKRFASHLEVRLPVAGNRLADSRVIGPDSGGWKDSGSPAWSQLAAFEYQEMRTRASE